MKISSKNIVKNKTMQDLADFLASEVGGKEAYSDANIKKYITNTYKDVNSQRALNDLAKQQAMGNIVNNVVNGGEFSYGDLGQLALQAGKDHPLKTMGLVGLLGGNLGGLTDGNGIGGQLLGGAGGALLASQINGVNPYTAAMLTLGGGQLGSLFDKLRQKKEEESQYAQQMQYRR